MKFKKLLASITAVALATSTMAFSAFAESVAPSDTNCNGATGTSHTWQNGTCTVCSKTCDHTSESATWTKTATTHKEVYDTCGGEKTAQANHTWDASTGKCTVTGCEYECLHPATTATSLSDGANHKLVCDTCGKETVASEACTPASTYVNTDGTNHWKVCTECGTKITSTEAAHDENGDYDKDASQHWKKCSVCGGTKTGVTKTNHTYDQAGNTCVCGATDPDAGSGGGDTPAASTVEIAFPTGVIQLSVGDNDDPNQAQKKASMQVTSSALGSNKTYGDLKNTTIKLTGVKFESCSIADVTAADVQIVIYTQWGTNWQHWKTGSFLNLSNANNATFDLSTITGVADSDPLQAMGIQIYINDQTKLASVEKGEVVKINDDGSGEGGGSTGGGTLVLEKTGDNGETAQICDQADSGFSGADLSSVNKVVFNANVADTGYGWNNGTFVVAYDSEWAEKKFGGSECSGQGWFPANAVVFADTGDFTVEIDCVGFNSSAFRLLYGTGNDTGAFTLKSVDFFNGSTKVFTWTPSTGGTVTPRPPVTPGGDDDNPGDDTPGGGTVTPPSENAPGTYTGKVGEGDAQPKIPVKIVPDEGKTLADIRAITITVTFSDGSWGGGCLGMNVGGEWKQATWSNESATGKLDTPNGIDDSNGAEFQVWWFGGNDNGKGSATYTITYLYSDGTTGSGSSGGGSNPPTPGNPGTPDTPSLPVSNGTLPSTAVPKNDATGTVIVDTITSSAAASLSFSLGSNTKIGKEIIDAIAAKGDVTVRFNVAGGAYWEINGANVTSAKAVDLGVRMNSKLIPASKVEEFAGDKTTVQLSLRHNGDLGFTGVLNVPINKSYNGKFANLYYYNGGNFDFVGSAAIAGGRAQFAFSHASNYLIVIDDYAYGEDVSSAAGMTETTEASAVPYVAALVVVSAFAASAVVLKKRLSK